MLPNPAPGSLNPDTHDLHYRTIRPEDWHRLQLFHERLSDTTVELRFHGAKRELSTPLAHRFTDLDGRDAVAVVATTGTRGRIVAVGRYARIDGRTAEVAFVVEDGYQHKGIGKQLMRRLIDTALVNGIEEFVAEVLPSNRSMLRLMRYAGPGLTRFDGSGLEVHADITGHRDFGAGHNAIQDRAADTPQ